MRIPNKSNHEISSPNTNFHCLEVAGATHFNVLAPVNELLARFIVEQAKTPGADTTITQLALDNGLANRKK